MAPRIRCPRHYTETLIKLIILVQSMLIYYGAETSLANLNTFPERLNLRTTKFALSSC